MLKSLRQILGYTGGVAETTITVYDKTTPSMEFSISPVGDYKKGSYITLNVIMTDESGLLQDTTGRLPFGVEWYVDGTKIGDNVSSDGSFSRQYLLENDGEFTFKAVFLEHSYYYSVVDSITITVYIPTSLTITHNATGGAVVIGTPVTFTGMLRDISYAPATIIPVADKSIDIIYYIEPGDWDTPITGGTGITGTDGVYEITVPLDKIGVWHLRAFYKGD